MTSPGTGLPVEIESMLVRQPPEAIGCEMVGLVLQQISNPDSAANHVVFAKRQWYAGDAANVATDGEGPVLPDTVSPAQMLVDHIRLYQPEPS